MASERITREIPRFSYEEHVAEAYTLMIATRTVLKTKMKRSKYNQFGQELRDFYAAFMQLYGLVLQRISEERGRELKEAIKVWDAKMRIFPSYNLSRHEMLGIKEGINLSEKLQEVLVLDGIFK